MKKNNFNIIKTDNLKNYYSFEYWLRMTPIFGFFKKISLFILKIFRLDKKLIGVKAGNIYIICKK